MPCRTLLGLDWNEKQVKFAIYSLKGKGRLDGLVCGTIT